MSDQEALREMLAQEVERADLGRLTDEDHITSFVTIGEARFLLAALSAPTPDLRGLVEQWERDIAKWREEAEEARDEGESDVAMWRNECADDRADALAQLRAALTEARNA
jgi:hypothetical protein